MLSLPQAECESYCREKRLERYEKYGGQVRHLPLHSFAHRILIPLMKASLYTKGNRLSILRDEQFHLKGITGPEEAFAFMDLLIPCWENAFLLNKRLSGLPF